MIFDTNRRLYCILEILKILNKGRSKYSILFKKTKVSHTTLQKALKDLEKNGFVRKKDIGHQKVDYTITERGKGLLRLLLQLENLL